MKNSKFLRKLLSGVCCLAMLVTMLPIVPVSAADPTVFFEDNFTGYTAGAFDSAVATAHGYKFVKASGSPVVNVTNDGGNQVLTITGARPYIEMGTPEGVFTVQMDVKRNAASSGLFELWMADLGNSKNIRFRVHDNGAFGFVDTATSKNYLVQNDGGFSNGGYNASRTDASNALLEANTWYRVEFVADPSANTLKLTARERDNASATVYQAERTMSDFSNHVLRMDGQDMTDSGSKINVSIDNIKVTNGAVEIGASSGGSAPAVGGTTISSGSLNNFSDTADITYTKAAEVTAGLGLFAGAEGKFMPKANVTRAQMATIIVKMLYGSNVNADSFKGTGKFTDVATFEGGWAEGYVNWCSTLGIVKGYGDGTFRPGSNVTTAEAATMILNALKVDAGAGTWPHTVMAKAEELNMFQELSPKPANDKALSREELAVMALVGLEYSPEGKTGYEYNGVTYDSYMDAYMVAGDKNAGKIKPTQGDSLAGKVFEMKTFEGFIVANEATDPDLAGVTTVFDPKAPATDATEDFYITTGLEHVGHYVTVYYQEAYINDEEPGLTYTIYDETRVVVVEEEIKGSSKEYKNAFGKSYRLNDSVVKFDGQYVKAADPVKTIGGYKAGSDAAEGTYFINEGAIVAYMEPVTVYAAQVLGVNTTQGYETIELSSKKAPISNSEDNDLVVEYKGIAEDDYVTYTVVGEAGVYVLAEAKPVTGPVSKVTTNEDGDKVVTVKGQQYVDFGKDNNTAGLTNGAPVDLNATYTFYVTADGKYIGWEKDNGTADLTNTVFILGQMSMDKADAYGKMTRTFYARGIDMDGKEVMLPVKTITGEYDKDTKDFKAGTTTEVVDTDCAAVGDKKFYTVKQSTQKDPKKDGLYVLTAISGTYDKDASPIYQASTSDSSGYSIGYNAISVAGRTAYTQSSAVFMTLTGVNANQAAPLTATVKKGSATTIANPNKDTINLYYLLSRDSNGTQMIEARVVMIGQSAAAISGGEGVYIAANWAETEGRNADGYTYTVYDYKTGSAKTVTLAKQIDRHDAYTTPGFYKLVAVEGESYMDIYARVPDSADTTVSNTKEGSADGFASENFFHDQLVLEAVGNYMTTMSLTAFGTYGTAVINREGKPAGAIVVDLRSEEKIAADGVGKIDSIDRIVNLQFKDDQIVIPLDICYSTSSNKVLTVFVKDVYYNTKVSGFEMSVEGGKTYVNGYAVAAGCEIVDNSYSGVTSLDQLYDLLNPEDLGDEYPNPEPATVHVEYTVAYGQITTITVTKILAAGIYLADDFESYDEGVFYQHDGTTETKNAMAIAKGFSFYKQDRTPLINVVEERGNKFIQSVTDRPLVRLGKPSEAFALKFDFRRDAEDSGRFEVWVGAGTYDKSGTPTSGTIRVRFMETGAVSILDQSVNSKNYYVQEATGKFSTKYGVNSNAADASNLKLDVNEWYTVELTVDAAANAVGMKIYEQGNASNLLADDTHICEEFDYTNVTMNFERVAANREPLVSIDNVEFKDISDHEYNVYPAGSVANGTVSVDPTKGVTGTQVTVTATPDTGYALKTILVKHGEDGTYMPISGNTFTVGEHPVWVSAEFEPMYTVSVGAVTGGTVTVEPTQAVAGTEITVTATPDDPTNVAEVYMNGQKIDGNTFEMPAKDVTVTVEFKPDPTPRAINVANVTGGTITVEPTQAAVGTIVTVNVALDDGYKVTRVTANGDAISGSNGTYTFTMPAQAVTVTAEYQSLIILQENFDSFDVGNFFDGTNKNAAALAKGYTMTKVSGTPAMDIVSKDGNDNALHITASRVYFYFNEKVPTSAATLSFDVKRNTSDDSGDINIWFAKLEDGTGRTLRLRIYKNGAISAFDHSGESKYNKNYWLRTDNTFNGTDVWTSGSGAEGNLILEKDVWYHVEFVIDQIENVVTLKVQQKGTNTVYQATRTCTKFESQNLVIDANGNPNIELDNFDYRLNG